MHDLFWKVLWQKVPRWPCFRTLDFCCFDVWRRKVLRHNFWRHASDFRRKAPEYFYAGNFWRYTSIFILFFFFYCRKPQKIKIVGSCIPEAALSLYWLDIICTWSVLINTLTIFFILIFFIFINFFLFLLIFFYFY